MHNYKYSIIIPVYNTEGYLKACLDSVKNQSYKNFEAIIINDGSTDNSEAIINKYLDDDRFVYLKQENMGVSIARNNGVLKATGDFITFLDSDDYLDLDCLKIVNDNLDEDIDILKVGSKKVGDDSSYHNVSFDKTSSEEAIYKLLNDSFMEQACSYFYKATFFKDNKFEYAKNRFHEDFGMTPFILEKARIIKALDQPLYYYVTRPGSIMQSFSEEAQDRKFNDALYLYNKLKDKLHNKYLISYLTNGIINKYFSLSKESQKKYKKDLREIKIANYLVSDNLKRWLKKKYYQIYFR